MLVLIFRILIVLLLLRMLWILYRGIKRGLRERPAGGTRQSAVALTRDPVCGTYVVPARALPLRDGSLIHYFCSERCRDAFVREPRTPE
jgi:YHS domain-containing protein